MATTQFTRRAALPSLQLHHARPLAECLLQPRKHRQGHAPGAGARKTRYDEGGQQPAQRAGGGPSAGGGQVRSRLLPGRSAATRSVRGSLRRCPTPAPAAGACCARAAAPATSRAPAPPAPAAFPHRRARADRGSRGSTAAARRRRLPRTPASPGATTRAGATGRRRRWPARQWRRWQGRWCRGPRRARALRGGNHSATILGTPIDTTGPPTPNSATAASSVQNEVAAARSTKDRMIATNARATARRTPSRYRPRRRGEWR